MNLLKLSRRVVVGLGCLLSLVFAASALAGANKNQVCIANDAGSGFMVQGWFRDASGAAIQTCCSGTYCSISTASTKCCKMTGPRSGRWQEGAYFDYTIYQGKGDGKVYPDLGQTCHFSGSLANVNKSKNCKKN